MRRSCRLCICIVLTSAMSMCRATFIRLIRNDREATRLREKANASFIEALSLGHKEKARALLAAGASVNASDTNDLTCLMHACIHNDPEMVQILLARQAIVTARDRDRRTALMHAAAKASHEIIQHLLDRGASVWDTDFEGKTALFYAVMFENAEALEYLLQKARVYSCENIPEIIKKAEIDQLLMHAVRARHYTIAKILLRYGVDPNCKVLKTQCPLLTAFLTNQSGMCELLVQYGADISCLGPAKRYLFDKSHNIY